MTAVLTPIGPAALNALDRGIALPVIYASIFGAPVRRADLRSRVVGVRVTEDEIDHALRAAALREFLETREGDVWFKPGSTPDVVRKFTERRAATARLLARHEAMLDFVRGLPRTRFVALSGGCAHETADDEDIDVFAVAEKGALWSTLLRATAVSKIKGWRRVLCLNYLVDETALELPWQDLSLIHI